MNSILNSKIESAASVISSKFNSKDEAVSWISKKLSELGIYNDDESLDILLSNDTKEGDARKVFCENSLMETNIPIARFRRVWSILKEGQTTEPATKDIESLIDSLKPACKLNDIELLERYGMDCGSEVEEELRKRSKDGYFVVFEPDNKTINKELTLTLLKQSKMMELPKIYSDGKKTYVIYKVGEYPEQIYDICPITGCILINQYSEKLGINWNLPLEAKQFIWVATQQGIEFSALSVRELSKVYSEDGIEGLKGLYPKVAVAYQELQLTGSLPSLKTTNRNQKRKSDPLNVEKSLFHRSVDASIKNLL